LIISINLKLKYYNIFIYLFKRYIIFFVKDKISLINRLYNLILNEIINSKLFTSENGR